MRRIRRKQQEALAGAKAEAAEVMEAKVLAGTGRGGLEQQLLDELRQRIIHEGHALSGALDLT